MVGRKIAGELSALALIPGQEARRFGTRKLKHNVRAKMEEHRQGNNENP